MILLTTSEICFFRRATVVLLLATTLSYAGPGFAVGDQLDTLRFRFEEHRGRTGKVERFVSRGSGYQLSLLPGGGSVLALTGSDRTAYVRANLTGANPAAAPEGIAPLSGQTHYLAGNDPSAWRHGVTSYARVRYRNVYPGIDLVYYGQDRQLEYDFVVAPGEDPGAVRFQISGARSLSANAAGHLVISTDAGEMQWKRPVVYQTIAGKRVPVDGGFAIRANGEVGFRIGAYDSREPLVIDPVLSYSSYVGGRGNEAARSIALDGAGNIYITGFTTSEDLPSTGGSVQASYGGGIAMHQSTGDASRAWRRPPLAGRDGEASSTKAATRSWSS